VKPVNTFNARPRRLNKKEKRGEKKKKKRKKEKGKKKERNHRITIGEILTSMFPVLRRRQRRTTAIAGIQKDHSRAPSFFCPAIERKERKNSFISK